MRYIGKWIQSLKDTEHPPPHELVVEYDVETRTKVIWYLNHGHVLHKSLGHAWCLFRCDYEEAYFERTDGTWVWPCDLSHYVETHNIRLPGEFISNAVASDNLPAFEEVWHTRDIDFSYWRRWCDDNRSGSLRGAIASRLEAATREAEQILTAEAKRLESEQGLDETQCFWAGCTNFALTGRHICGRCSLKAYEDTYVSHLFDPYTVMNS